VPFSSGPYTVSAVDYHFHDAHPSRPIRLDQGVRFRNVGQNIHNVTFETVQYSRDLLVGALEVIDPVSSLFPGPGRYRFHCAYHLDRKMTGVLVIV
jgi:plastocyanin